MGPRWAEVGTCHDEGVQDTLSELLLHLSQDNKALSSEFGSGTGTAFMVNMRAW